MGSTDSTATVEPTEAQREFIDGLREMADFLEANPDIPATLGTTNVANVNAYSDEDEEPRERLARIARVPGGWEKQATGDDFQLVRLFGPHKLIVFAARDAVCERVVTGTETVTVPAVEPEPERTEELELVEWVCPESILAGAER